MNATESYVGVAVTGLDHEMEHIMGLAPQRLRLRLSRICARIHVTRAMYLLGAKYGGSYIVKRAPLSLAGDDGAFVLGIVATFANRALFSCGSMAY